MLDTFGPYCKTFQLPLIQTKLWAHSHFYESFRFTFTVKFAIYCRFRLVLFLATSDIMAFGEVLPVITYVA